MLAKGHLALNHYSKLLRDGLSLNIEIYYVHRVNRLDKLLSKNHTLCLAESKRQQLWSLIHPLIHSMTMTSVNCAILIVHGEMIVATLSVCQHLGLQQTVVSSIPYVEF